MENNFRNNPKFVLGYLSKNSLLGANFLHLRRRCVETRTLCEMRKFTFAARSKKKKKIRKKTQEKDKIRPGAAPTSGFCSLLFKKKIRFPLFLIVLPTQIIASHIIFVADSEIIYSGNP